mmetsp:Transcript_2716/g.6023  ORF Transcript_2716/g.6023 Transcript_2716/m.6023 type:complete len:110 (-) Transcript_2716:1780-2109(-)
MESSPGGSRSRSRHGAESKSEIGGVSILHRDHRKASNAERRLGHSTSYLYLLALHAAINWETTSAFAVPTDERLRIFRIAHNLFQVFKLRRLLSHPNSDCLLPPLDSER